MVPSSEALHARVTRLERGTRRDRAIVFGVIVLAVVTAQSPATAPAPNITQAPISVRTGANSATLSASGMTVADVSGRRMFIGLDDQGRPSVDLYDKTGQIRESLYLFGGDHPTLRQFDATGKRRAEFRLGDNDKPEIQLSDPSEKLRAALFMTSDDRPQMGLYGSDEHLRAFFSTDDVSPYLVMRDATQVNRVNIGGYADGTIGMDIRSAANVVLWKAP